MVAGPRNRETMIALRANREAIQIARDVACPYIELPPPPDLTLQAALPPTDDELIRYAPAERVICQPVIDLAPWWMIWVLVGCLVLLLLATILILRPA